MLQTKSESSVEKKVSVVFPCEEVMNHFFLVGMTVFCEVESLNSSAEERDLCFFELVVA